MAYAGAGGTDGSESSLLLYLIILPLILGYAAYVAIMKFYATRAAAVVLARAAQRDRRWDRDTLIQHVRTVFVNVQTFWSKNDLESAIPCLHPNYVDEFAGLLANNEQAGLVNMVSNIKLRTVDIVLAKDYADNDQDMFVAHISGTMDDVMQTEMGRVVKTQGDKKGESEREIDEYWRFQRLGDTWLLRQISQDDGVLSNEVSLDAETLFETHTDGAHLTQLIHTAEEQERVNQLRFKWVAWGIGLAITCLGYYLYFMLFKGAWGFITNFLF